MMREMKYRDIEDVNTLLQESFEEEYAEMNIDTARRLKYMKRGYILERLVSLVVTGYKKFLDFVVYEDEDKVRAALRITRHSENTFYFATIAVDKKYKRKGIGFNLMAFGEDFCKKRGGKYVIGVVKEENVPSFNMLMKLGFSVYDENYMYLLKNVLPYRNRDVKGFRTLKKEDYEKVRELEKKIMSKEVLQIEGSALHYSFIGSVTHIFRELLFKEKFCEYVLERENKITAYSTVSHLLDGSSLIVLMSCEEDLKALKNFVEKILYKNAGKTMRTIVAKNQTAERNVLTELGFKEYSHLYAVYKPLG